MKKQAQVLASFVLVLGMVLTGFSSLAAAASDVCGRGLSEPPFLSFGVNSNLLMLLDNSGSMLDMAYVDPDKDCFDDNFLRDPVTAVADASLEYAGNFKLTDDTIGKAWYKWVAKIEPWTKKIYAQGDRVYENGVVYKAKSIISSPAKASTGNNIYEDTEVEWEPLLRPTWTNGKKYPAKSFVFTAAADSTLYYTATGGIANGTELLNDSGVTDWQPIDTWENDTFYTAGTFVMWKDVLYTALTTGTSSPAADASTPWEDKGVTWEEVSPFAWQSGSDYAAGYIVTYDGMLFEAKVAHTSGGSTLYEDDFTNNWTRIDDGYYEMVTAIAAESVCATADLAPDTTKYTTSDLCLTMYKDPAGVQPKLVTAFAASGNMLNWLMASKFDIQKNILTGGKYNPHTKQLISENRGCAGSRFTKQIRLDNGEYLVITVRGSRNTEELKKRDRIDNSDDTSRIEILAVTATPYDSASCQAAADCVMEGGDALGCQGSIDQCLSGTGTAADARAALNHSLQYCSQNSPKIKPTLDNCLNLYPQLNPAQIANYSNAYACYGIYDKDRRHDTDRIGYIGRCWASGTSLAGSTCDPKANDLSQCVPPANKTCQYTLGALLLRNVEKTGYVEYCTNITGPDTCKNAAAWAPYYTDSLSNAQCDPNVCPYAVGCGGTPPGFSSDLDGIAGVTAADTALVPNPLPVEMDPNNTGLTDEAAYCVYKAMEDYCDSLTTPQVIDPSEQTTTTTGEYGNIPALLITSGVLSQLGVDVPIAVMKGYLRPTDPADATQVQVPTGLLQSKAAQLRIGAMAFNSVGAFTECQAADTTDRIDEYCPGINKDGAQVITPIRLGNLVTDSVNNRLHVDDLVTNINGVRATAWTPLAEAYFNAVGYYSQNKDVRLDVKDFQVDAEVAAWQAGVEYGKGFFVIDGTEIYQTILGGKSSGGSRATDSGATWIKTGNFKDAWSETPPPTSTYVPKDIVRAPDGKLFITYTGGTPQLKGGAATLLKTGPLYDEGVTWEPLLDPVSSWCQDNNILIITEGASTADVNSSVSTFLMGTALTGGQKVLDGTDTDADPVLYPTQCTNGLKGSTYLDDLAWFAKDTDDTYDLYPAGNITLPEGDYPYDGKEKKNITTHVVISGSLRDVNKAGDPAECNPKTIMERTAANGGTDKPVESNNPAQLKKNLEAIFDSFRQRASAGSAASVISSARGGEGAIYQAIFWPELARTANNIDYTVAWAGDVHGLFLDNRGFMYEDTDGNRKLEPYEDIDGDGKIDKKEAIAEDIDGDGNFDKVDEDRPQPGLPHGDGNLDVAEVDTDGDGVADPGEDVDGDGYLDPVKEDLDDDGYLDTGEDTNHNGVLDAGELDLDGDGLDRDEDLNDDNIFQAYIDLDSDGHPDVEEDLDYPGYSAGVIDGHDKRVLIYYDITMGRSMACYDTSILNLGACTTPVELSAVKFIWSAADWLGKVAPANRVDVPNINDPNLLENRTTYTTTTSRRRYIFTWNDLDNNGIVPDGDSVDGTGEILEFEPGIDWAGLTVSADRGSALQDFDLATNTDADNLIKWLRGRDWPFVEDTNGNGVIDGAEVDRDPADGPGPRKPLRSRLVPDINGDLMTWRLGDIIHSTPMTVAAPAEGYHLIYNDYTYAQFVRKYKQRRHVVYYGANDGMLHATNAGFFNEEEKKFCLTPDRDASNLCTDTESDAANGTQTPFELGTELWSYVPYNLLPHLNCLASTGYNHKYFVDQRPRIFDVQIFAEEGACKTSADKYLDPACIHPNGWGTILVGGMRFGGAPINATELNSGADNRQFSSSWFILDITNPEEEPTVLGEMSFKNNNTTIDLGYTTAMPSMVGMKEATDTNWYLIFGSGPHEAYGTTPETAIKGVSTQNAQIGILPLDRLVTRGAVVNDHNNNPVLQTSAKYAMRLPAIDSADPLQSVFAGEGDGAGTIPLDTPTGGFISDMVTIDYDINPSYREYKADAVYFGTVEGTFATQADGRYFWDGGGKLYRLVTKEINTTIQGLGILGSFYGRNTPPEAATTPPNWQIKPLIDLTATGMDGNPGPGQPITAAPSVGTDGQNFWIYFGTGRFFDANDKTDTTQQSYYGIKEPAVFGKRLEGGTLKPTRFFTWEEVEKPFNNGNLPGAKGLWDVTKILVGMSSRIDNSPLTCADGGDACLPDAVKTSPYLSTLDKFIAGTSIDTYDESGNKTGPAPEGLPCVSNGCADGWVRDFYPQGNRERNVGQSTLLGGLVTYTTYQPFNDVCQAEGNAYLYAEYYRTGTAWHKNIFGRPEGLDGNNVRDKLSLGRGMATTPNLHVGAGEGSNEGPKAFVQTSTGEILEIEQENLPINVYKTGRSKWKEYNP